MKLSIKEIIDNKLNKLISVKDSGITIWTNIEDLLSINSLDNTCTMSELSFEESRISTKNLKIFTKKEFDYIVSDNCFDARSIITNVPNNSLEDKYLKTIGYESVSSYRGHRGTINTYIFVNPEYKPRVRKTSK